MMVCPNCKHTNMTGAMFCDECGAQLIGADMFTTQNIAMDEAQEAAKQGFSSAKAAPPITLNTWVTLHLMDTGQMLPLSDRDEFTLGRISEGQPIMPDLDLSPYQAYASGVSIESPHGADFEQWRYHRPRQIENASFIERILKGRKVYYGIFCSPAYPGRFARFV